MAVDRSALVICGAGGHGRVVAAAARAAGRNTIVFLDPRWPATTEAGGWAIEGDGGDLAGQVAGRPVIAGIGDNARRMALLGAMEAVRLEIATIVHPTAWLCPSVVLGAGTVVMAQAAVNNGARIGHGVIINTGAIVEHDCTLADGVHVSPGAVLAGNVTVEAGAWIGAGASLRQGVRIGAGAIVGLGAAVIADVPPGETWGGVPARRLRTR